MRNLITDNSIEERISNNRAKPRYYLLDTIRGICIILVVLYHLLYDLSEVFGGHYSFFKSNGMNIFRDGFVGVLIFLAGISCNLTRSNLKRGVKTFLCGMLISLVMLIAMPQSKVVFGILHFLGVGMMLYGILERVFAKLPVSVGFLGFFLLFMLTLGVHDGYFGWPGIFVLEFSKVPKNIILFILGFKTGHGSGDYWPIIPWLFLFLSGTYLGRYFKEGNVPVWFTKNPVPPLSFIGRKTLIIYLLHQPIIYGILWLIFK